MGYIQLREPDTTVGENPGWCLGMATKVFFGAAWGYGCATDAWNASPTKNGSREMPGVAVPVWFSWWGTIDGVNKDWGHVVVWIPGRGFLSSPGSWSDPYGQQWFGSIEEIERWFGCVYQGFTLDIMPNGDVAAWTNDPAPSPEPGPAPAPSPDVRTHEIVSGDTLWDLAIRFYGDGSRYMEIFNASNFRSGQPGLIYPGEIAVIP